MTTNWVPGAAILKKGDRGTSRLARSIRAGIKEWHRPVMWVRESDSPYISVSVGVGAGGGGGGLAVAGAGGHSRWRG